MSISPYQTSKLLLFAAAGLPMAIPVEDLLRVLPDADILPIPLGHPALHGALLTTEGVCPVYDLAVLANTKPSPTPLHPGTWQRAVALFQHALGPVAIRVERLAGLASEVTPLPASTQAGLMAALPDFLQTLITGATTSRGQLFFLFSCDAFVGWLSAQVDAAPAHPSAR